MDVLLGDCALQLAHRGAHSSQDTLHSGQCFTALSQYVLLTAAAIRLSVVYLVRSVNF